jgi:hypothetical protein
MARLKFLVFAVIALGLWGYHLAQVSPLAVVGAIEQANASVSGATAPVALALESRRSLTQAIALKVATTATAAWNAGPKAGAKPEAPTVDRFASVRSAAHEALPPELKELLFVAVINEVGSLSVKGTGEPASSSPEGVDLVAMAQSGSQGATLTLDGVGYLGFAAPIAISDKNEVKQAGSLIVALPLLPDAAVLESTRRSLNLQSIALFADGKAVLKAGDDSATAAFGALKPGATGSLSQGPVRELGPIELPILIPSTPQQVGTRQAIAGTTFEVTATASSRAALDALAAYQVFALGGLVGLLLLSLVFTIIIGGGEEAGPGMVMPPQMPVPPKREDAGLKPNFTPQDEAPAPPQEQSPAEASPDDFDFPPAGSTGQNAFPAQQNFAPPPPAPAHQFQEPTSDPFAQAAPPPPPPARPVPPPPIATSEVAAFQPGGVMDEDEGQRTVAYPAFKGLPGMAPGAADPFALAAAQEEPPAAGFDDNVDATRVAAVPAELIKAARAGSGATSERPAMKPAGASMPKVAALPVAGGNDEERHFQEVFRDFVATREKCREPADGLTLEKFKTKLLKNKEQLVAKYQCRTVRFQVYVKDGKAALKATPVKD